MVRVYQQTCGSKDKRCFTATVCIYIVETCPFIDVRGNEDRERGGKGWFRFVLTTTTMTTTTTKKKKTIMPLVTFNLEMKRFNENIFNEWNTVPYEIISYEFFLRMEVGFNQNTTSAAAVSR